MARVREITVDIITSSSSSNSTSGEVVIIIMATASIKITPEAWKAEVMITSEDIKMSISTITVDAIPMQIMISSRQLPPCSVVASINSSSMAITIATIRDTISITTIMGAITTMLVGALEEAIVAIRTTITTTMEVDMLIMEEMQVEEDKDSNIHRTITKATTAEPMRVATAAIVMLIKEKPQASLNSSRANNTITTCAEAHAISIKRTMAIRSSNRIMLAVTITRASSTMVTMSAAVE